MPEQPISPRNKTLQGSGVPRRVTVEEKAETPEPELEHEKDDSGHTKWQDEPSLADQFTRYRRTCKICATQFKVFNLSVSEELKAMNKVMEDTIPKDAPKCQVKLHREFYAGSYHVIMEYQQIKYMKLLPRK